MTHHNFKFEKFDPSWYELAMQFSSFCHDSNTIKSLNDYSRELVLSLAEGTGAKSMLSPLEYKAELWSTMAKHRIMIPQEVFQTLEFDDSIEMWTSDIKFMFAMGPILSQTSYSITDLNSQPWEILFERDELVKQQILNRLMSAISTGKPQFDVTEWHIVRETAGEQSSLTVKIKLIAPFSSSHGHSGFIAVVKSKPPSANALAQ